MISITITVEEECPRGTDQEGKHTDQQGKVSLGNIKP